MSDYHHIHWVSFYKQSLFSAPIFVSMNCVAFNALSHLSEHDADLFSLSDRYFICRAEAHRAAVCPKPWVGYFVNG
jgi:hypothetical protein